MQRYLALVEQEQNQSQKAVQVVLYLRIMEIHQIKGTENQIALKDFDILFFLFFDYGFRESKIDKTDLRLIF